MVVQPLHDFELSENLLVAALLFHDEFFAHSLDGIEGSRVFLSGQVYLFSEASLANHFNLVKVLHGHHHRIALKLFMKHNLLVILGGGTAARGTDTLLFLFHLLGEDCDKGHFVFEYFHDSFFAHSQPKIDVFIFV